MTDRRVGSAFPRGHFPPGVLDRADLPLWIRIVERIDDGRGWPAPMVSMVMPAVLPSRIRSELVRMTRQRRIERHDHPDPGKVLHRWYQGPRGGRFARMVLTGPLYAFVVTRKGREDAKARRAQIEAARPLHQKALADALIGGAGGVTEACDAMPPPAELARGAEGPT